MLRTEATHLRATEFIPGISRALLVDGVVGEVLVVVGHVVFGSLLVRNGGKAR